MSDLLETCQGWRIPLGEIPHTLKRLVRDRDGHPRGERINGYVECPKCGLAWPLIEEPDCWKNVAIVGELWVVDGWGPGTAECIECGKLFVDTFEGCFELRML